MTGNVLFEICIAKDFRQHYYIQKDNVVAFAIDIHSPSHYGGKVALAEADLQYRIDWMIRRKAEYM